MMMRKEVYEKTGGFDEDFFMYGEDLDLCYRIQKEGYKVFYVHSAQIIHYKGESTKRSSIDDTKLFYDAMHLFVKKHFSTSLLVEIILQAAIFFRKFFAFLGKKRFIILPLLIDVVIFDLSLILCRKNLFFTFTVGWFPTFNLSTWFLLYQLSSDFDCNSKRCLQKRFTFSTKNIFISVDWFFHFIVIDLFLQGVCI